MLFFKRIIGRNRLFLFTTISKYGFLRFKSTDVLSNTLSLFISRYHELLNSDELKLVLVSSW